MDRIPTSQPPGDPSLATPTAPPRGDSKHRWDAIRDHIRRNYHVAVDGPGSLGLLWTFPNAEGVQRQRVEAVVAFGAPHVVITSNVGSAATMTCYDALIHNGTLAIGALCFLDGHLVLRMILPLEGVDISVIDRSLQLVAHEAARLRSKETPKAAPAPYYE